MAPTSPVVPEAHPGEGALGQEKLEGSLGWRRAWEPPGRRGCSEPPVWMGGSETLPQEVPSRGCVLQTDTRVRNNAGTQGFLQHCLKPKGKTPRSQCRGPGFDSWSGN